MARISVLMNVYNVEAYVAEALASIQRQTVSDIEIIVVDDGSEDGTRAIAESIASADLRIKVVGTAKNLGIPHALNLGLKFCTAPFIAKVDGDDIALPTRLERQLQFLEDNPDIALVGCATVAIDQLGRPIPGLSISCKPLTQEEVFRTVLLATPCFHIWLARREVYDTLLGYRTMELAEDYDFLLRCLTSGFLLSNLPEALMQIRTRPGNVSSLLEQRKAHRYIANLYRERIKSGQDSFSEEGYERAIKPAKVENVAFRLATKCVRKGLQSRSRILRFVLLALSALLSPWQARYFLDRIRFKVALRASSCSC
jgi:glycosyltransferase involved in cell wall biosynthesis